MDPNPAQITHPTNLLKPCVPKHFFIKNIKDGKIKKTDLSERRWEVILHATVSEGSASWPSLKATYFWGNVCGGICFGGMRFRRHSPNKSIGFSAWGNTFPMWECKIIKIEDDAFPHSNMNPPIHRLSIVGGMRGGWFGGGSVWLCVCMGRR